MAVVAALDQAQQGHNVHLYTYGQPRVGEKNFAAYQNSIITSANLRAVYRNDPVPTVPFVDVLDFIHAGTEVHFYECNPLAYIAFPFNTDDSPVTDLFAVSDHEGYFCLYDSNVKPAGEQFME